jgi:hypothetical protein
MSIDQRYRLLESICILHGLTLKEYEILTCAMDGKMTDGEIRACAGVDADEFDELVAGLKARDLIGRRKGYLVASIEGRSAYYDVPPIAA